MNINKLNCVLLVLIVGMIIIMIIKIVNKHTKSAEYMNIKEEQVIPQVSQQKTDTSSVNSSTETQINSTNTAFTKQPQVQREILPQFCNANEMEDNNHRLIRDIVMGKKLEQPETQHSFSNAEIKNYQSDFLDFDNKINYNSSNNVNPIDKLNELYTTNNNEITAERGQNISDVFDGLTKNEVEKMKLCKYQNCIIPGKNDAVQNMQYYTCGEDKNRELFLNDFNRYEFDEDNVNNGGSFYNNIQGNDMNMIMNPVYRQ